MNALAVDTGGRALRNQNSFGQFINELVAETSRYYLLAWRPESGDEKTVKKIGISEIIVCSRWPFSSWLICYAQNGVVKL